MKRYVGWALIAALVSGANAADPLPDRRAVRPSASAPAPAPAVPAPTQQGMLELLSEMEALQTQMRYLRGQLEVQAREIEQMKNRQHQLMLDYDKRLRDVERRSTAGSDDNQTPSTIVTPPVGGAALPPVSSAPGSRPVASASEQQQYDAAFSLLKQGQYEQAAKGFRDFISRNPKGPLADNAQYWVGEVAYVTRDFRVALDEFGKVVNNYPQSEKLADALLKIGYTHYELSAYAKAREMLGQVTARYPNTAAARAAEARLEKMAKEGR